MVSFDSCLDDPQTFGMDIQFSSMLRACLMEYAAYFNNIAIMFVVSNKLDGFGQAFRAIDPKGLGAVIDINPAEVAPVHDVSYNFTTELHDLLIHLVALIKECIAGDEPRLAETGGEND